MTDALYFAAEMMQYTIKKREIGMDQVQFIKNLSVPMGKVDVVMDTDAYNEIDDQFAICYLLLKNKFNVKGFCAAPFLNKKSVSPEDGMEKSHAEIRKLLSLLSRDDIAVFKGSRNYLIDENTAVESDAAEFMARLADLYSPENPLYIIAIGAITNVASAILKNPNMKENCVVVWLGGHGIHTPRAASEFNMTQDIAAARVVFGCGVPLVQLPCRGVVDRLLTTKYELAHWIKGKNELCDYLYENSVFQAEHDTSKKTWSRVIWDVSAVAWLLNRDDRLMRGRLIPGPVPEYDKHYAMDPDRHFIRYVYTINRDAVFEDLFETLGAAYENI